MTNPNGNTIKRIYDQVSLRDHVKSDRFQRSDYRTDSAIDKRILLLPGAKFKQFFRGIQQGQSQHQLRITISKSASDLLKLSIYKLFDRFYFRLGSGTPHRKLSTKDCHCMAFFHTMTMVTF